MEMVGAALRTLWAVATLPFRLIARAVEMLGRLAALALGFALMVVGVAIGAGPLPVVGVPLFLIGLFVTLRSMD